MGKYRKRAVEVRAIRWTGDNFDEVYDTLGPFNEWNIKSIEGPVDDKLLIETLEGTMHAKPGDYIIRGVEGELYPCKPTIFNRTYEHVDD